MTMTMTTETVTSIQVWPTGEMYQYNGRFSSAAEMQIFENGAWRAPTPIEYRRIHNSALAEIYRDRDVLQCQTSLVEMLLGNDTEGFSIDDIENLIRPEQSDDLFKVFHAGCNMPGFIPDEPPHPCTDHQSAVAALGESLENHFDNLAADGFQPTDGNLYLQYRQAIDDLRKHGCADFNGYHYFISEDTLTREELESCDVDPDDYESLEEMGELREVLEWWLVSDWLANQLADIGAPVIRNDYGSWWGRTCSGQGFIMDGTLQDVANQFCD